MTEDEIRAHAVEVAARLFAGYDSNPTVDRLLSAARRIEDYIKTGRRPY